MKRIVTALVLAPVLALLLGVAPARADEPPADARAKEAAKLVEAGQPNQAILLYRRILSDDPARVDAHDGLVRAQLATGDTEGAARTADARLALRPDDAAWQRWRLYLLGLAPSRRAEAITGYQALLAVSPDDADALRNVALFLSWSGRLPESVSAWRRALSVEPAHAGARLGLARTLAWSGENAEAITLFDALLAEDPKHVDALLGRSQLARWTGDRATARALLERAEALAPTDPRVRAERSRLELDSGRRAVARGAAASALEVSPDLFEGREALAALRDATAPRVGVRFAGSEESTGFRRLGVALPVEFHALPDTRLRIEPAYARFGVADLPEDIVQAPDIDRLSIGAEVRQTGLPQGLYARGAYRLHALLGIGATHEVDLEVGTVRPLDLPVELGIGARQRALADAPVDDAVIAPLNTSGSGGSTLGGLSDQVQVREAYVGLLLAPLPGLYVYGDGALGAVTSVDTTDEALTAGPARRSVAAGLGQDVLRLLRVRTTHALTVRYDLYHLAVAEVDPRYFSPETFLVHTPGLEWRWSPGRVTVGVEGGVPLRADAPVGWLAGGFAAVDIGEHLDVSARLRTIDDTAWRATAASVAVTGSW